MNWKDRADNFWIGLLTGLLFPAILFFIYWLYFYHQLSFPSRFIRFLLDGNMLSGVIKICGLGNLLLFWLSLTKRMDRFSKGIILSVFLYIALIAYITYYLEVVVI
jgi:hypothetical protein